jgi:hypothetical protein
MDGVTIIEAVVFADEGDGDKRRTVSTRAVPSLRPEDVEASVRSQLDRLFREAAHDGVTVTGIETRRYVR